MVVKLTIQIVFFVVIAEQVLSVPSAPVTKKDIPHEQNVFRADYIYDDRTETFYKLHKMPRTFVTAGSICSAEGAELAIPKTEFEAKVLNEKMSNQTKFLWLSLHDVYAEGEFFTLNGQSESEVYTNWRDGEPNDAGGNEDCTRMNENGQYNDVTCDNKYNFMCTKHKSTVSYNTPCRSHDRDYFYNIERNQCYKLHKVPMTWHDAFKTCKAELASLAVINNADEAKYMSEIISQYPIESLKGTFEKHVLHLDFSDLMTPGIFKTSTGQKLEDVGYEEWSTNQPDNGNQNEHCGSMFRNGKLNDHNCQSKAMFFCEKKFDSSPYISYLQRMADISQQ